MVIFYNLETKEILRTEDNRMTPALPTGTLEEQKRTYSDEGIGVISLPYEMGINIFDYNLCFNESGAFVGITPKV